MKPIEIIVIIASAAIVAGVIIAAIVRKVKGKKSCDCGSAGCSSCPYSANCNTRKNDPEK